MSTTKHFARRPIAALIASVFAVAAAPAFAQSAGGNAFQVSASITVAGLIHFDISPTEQVQTTPQSAPFDNQQSLLDWGTSNAVGSISIGALTSTLQYAPSGNQVIAGAESLAANVNLGLVSLLGADLLSITAEQIRAINIIAGTCPVALPKTGAATHKAGGVQTNDIGDVIADMVYGNGFDTQNLNPSNTVQLPNLSIKILGIQVPDLPLTPPPNTGIDLQALGLVGATLMLNEQTNSGDGVTTRSLTSNAVHLTLNVAGLVTADVTLGHAQISVDCAG